MNAPRVVFALSRLLIVVFMMPVLTSICGAQERGPWLREPEEIRRTLDSLASISVGPYVHFVVGSCPGGRCEERVSIYRPSGDVPFLYRAAAWVGEPGAQRWYGVNREISDEDAGALLADARLAGIMTLLADTAAPNNRHARFWLRARFGRTAVHINDASLGAASYAKNSSGGQMTLFKDVEAALTAWLRQYYLESQ